MLNTRLTYTLLAGSCIIIAGCASDDPPDTTAETSQTPSTVITAEPEKTPESPRSQPVIQEPVNEVKVAPSDEESTPVITESATADPHPVIATPVVAASPTPVVPPVGYPGTAAEADETGQLSVRMEKLVEQAQSKGLSPENMTAVYNAQEQIEKTLSAVTPDMPREQFEKRLNEARKLATDAENLVNRN